MNATHANAARCIRAEPAMTPKPLRFRLSSGAPAGLVAARTRVMRATNAPTVTSMT